jgi:hypothetical protein
MEGVRVIKPIAATHTRIAQCNHIRLLFVRSTSMGDVTVLDVVDTVPNETYDAHTHEYSSPI